MNIEEQIAEYEYHVSRGTLQKAGKIGSVIFRELLARIENLENDKVKLEPVTKPAKVVKNTKTTQKPVTKRNVKTKTET